MPRLYHTKSKTGCRRCRERRVKCDEVHPTCGSCGRHNVSCVYDRPSDPSPVSRPGSSSHSRQSTSSSIESPAIEPLTAETRERRIMEIGLLHYFVTDVVSTLSGAFLDSIKRVWTIDVPKLALEYEPLLNAILVISMLHMQATGYQGLPLIDDIPTLRARYRNATLSRHLQTIGNMPMARPIAEAASFASILLSYDALADMRERQLEPYQPPMHWLHMCKGVMNAFIATRDLVRREPNSIINVAIEVNESLVEPSVIFCEANRTRFPYLVERGRDATETEVDHEAYLDTLCYIGATMRALEAGENVDTIIRRVVVFAILLPSRFLELLSQLKPRALVILAHFFATASHCYESWYIDDTPAREIRAIAKYIGTSWQAEMEWPLKTISEGYSLEAI